MGNFATAGAWSEWLAEHHGASPGVWLALAKKKPAALAERPRAAASFATLGSRNGYAVLFRIQIAKKVETRALRIARFVEMLERHETLHP